jgi:hypothetical protein
MTFDTIYNLILYYKDRLVADEKISVTDTIHGQQLNFNIYKLPNVFTFSSNTEVRNIFSLCKTEDAATQLIIGGHITIDSDVIFTPPYRCKGMIIYCNVLSNNGNISMKARGAKGDGNDLYLCKINDQYQIVPKNGALGADRVDISAKWEGPWAANRGYNGIGRQTGGGANGAQGHGNGDHWSWIYSMGGGDATSYSGGSGGGGCDVNHPGSFTMPKPVPGTGPGGDGYGARWSSSWYNRNGGGGAGNPGGRGRYASGWSTDLDGESGTGGLLIIYSSIINGNGLYTADGSQGGGGNKGGGGSGGGSINIFTGQNIVTQLQLVSSVKGGTSKSNGGTGGDGTLSIDNFSELLNEHTIIKVNYLVRSLTTNKFVVKETEQLLYTENFIPKNLRGLYFTNIEYSSDNYIITLNCYYERNSYNLIVRGGTSLKYTYLFEEQGNLQYTRGYFNDSLSKFKNWKSDDQVEIYAAFLKDTTFKMPAQDITIYAESTNQDRVNTNIYKNIFENILFDLYKIQNNITGVYKQENTIFQYKHNFDLYDLVYQDNNGLYKKGLANEEQYGVIGIVSKIVNASEFVLLTFGQIETNYNFSSDSGILYLSDTEPGKFCTYDELTTNFYTPIGFYTGNTITLNILDSSVGDVLKKYCDTVYEHEQDLPHITETDKQNIIQEVFNNA